MMKKFSKKLTNCFCREGSNYGLSLNEKANLRKELFRSIRKLDVLQELLEDTSITEIMVNGWDKIFIEREGHLITWNKTFTSSGKLEDVIQQIVARCNRVINTLHPIVDARLENGARVNAVIPPVSVDGPILTIRQFPKEAITENSARKAKYYQTGIIFFAPSGKSTLYYFNRRWNRSRKNDFFKCTFRLYSKR